jgi:hypothetical protein
MRWETKLKNDIGNEVGMKISVKCRTFKEPTKAVAVSDYLFAENVKYININEQ